MALSEISILQIENNQKNLRAKQQQQRQNSRRRKKVPIANKCSTGLLVVAAAATITATLIIFACRSAQAAQYQVNSSQAATQPTGLTSVSGRPNYLETGRQITGILDRFMSLGYDKRVRPNYGGPPVEVNVTMRILSISSVSEVMMDFTADFYFRQTWHDPRLSFKKLGDIQTLYVGAEVSKKIWLPDTFFGNEKMAYFHEATTPNVFLRIDHSGEVYRSIRLTVTSSCPMNLQYFPMDRQRCTIEAESYGYNVKDIIYRWARKDTAVERDKEISLPQFDIVQTVQKYRLEELSSGTYSRLIAEIHFARRMGYYLIQIYIPSSLIVVISWVSFWLHRNASPARVQLGVTTVLTMTTLMSSTNAALPKISYVKSIDIFLGTCFVMVFAALLEYATVGYLGKRIAMRKAQAQHAQSQANARILAQLQQAHAGEPFCSTASATSALAAAAAAAMAANHQTHQQQQQQQQHQQHQASVSLFGSADIAGGSSSATGTAVSSGGVGLMPFGVPTGGVQSSPLAIIGQPSYAPTETNSSEANILAAAAIAAAAAAAVSQPNSSKSSNTHHNRPNHHHHQHNHHHHHHHQHDRQSSPPPEIPERSRHHFHQCYSTTTMADPRRCHQAPGLSSCKMAGTCHEAAAQDQHHQQQAGQRSRNICHSCSSLLTSNASAKLGFCQTLPRNITFAPGIDHEHQRQCGHQHLSIDHNHHNHDHHHNDNNHNHNHHHHPTTVQFSVDQPALADDTCCRHQQTSANNAHSPIHSTTTPIPHSAASAAKQGASSATAAAAAQFVNLHRRNKGLPPSTNPNFAQFNALNSPFIAPYNRALETIFGIRPSDIDKYSRVVFPVCFVCFQLMYWIVYLHISAFLDSEQGTASGQQAQTQPVPIPPTLQNSTPAPFVT